MSSPGGRSARRSSLEARRARTQRLLQRVGFASGRFSAGAGDLGGEAFLLDTLTGCGDGVVLRVSAVGGSRPGASVASSSSGSGHDHGQSRRVPIHGQPAMCTCSWGHSWWGLRAIPYLGSMALRAFSAGSCATCPDTHPEGPEAGADAVWAPPGRAEEVGGRRLHCRCRKWRLPADALSPRSGLAWPQASRSAPWRGASVSLESTG